MNRKSHSLLSLCLVALVVAGCKNSRVYDHYEHTPLSGWEKNDTLFFDIPPVAQGGSFHEELSLRVNGAYPFMQLSMIVEQMQLPMGFHRADTLNLKLQDHDGRVMGHGVNYFQYSFPITNLQLNSGDSLHVIVRHNMKREILPGIADVGFRLVSLSND